MSKKNKWLILISIYSIFICPIIYGQTSIFSTKVNESLKKQLDINGKWNYLSFADGTTQTTSASALGYVVGPSSSVDSEIAIYNSTTGKLLKRFGGTGILKATSGVIDVAIAGDFPTLNQNTTGNAATVTTNANLTGHVTSTGNAAVLGSFSSANLAGALSDETGSGASVFGTSPTLVGTVGMPSGNINLGSTTNANQFGIISKNGLRFIHNFNYGNNGTVTTAGYNTFVGENAGNLTMGSTATQTSEGSYNTAIGCVALTANTTGYYNTASGVNALLYNTTGYQNTASGVNALYSNNTGYSNTANGTHALRLNTTGYNNTTTGTQSLYSNTTGFNNTANGTQALYYNTSVTSSTAIGYQSGRGISNYSAGELTIVGAEALYNITTGAEGITALGYRAGYANTTGANNTYLGYKAGDNITTGSNNIVIGYNIDAPSAVNSNQMTIGNILYGTGISGVGTTPSTGNIGIGMNTPPDTLTMKAAGTVGVLESYTDASNYSKIKQDMTSSGAKFEIVQAGTGIANRPFVFRQTSSATGTGWDFQTGTGTSVMKVDVKGKMYFDGIGDSTASPGNATLNTVSGKSAIAAGASACTITNSNVTTSSLVFLTPEDNDATLLTWKAVSASGSFTVTGNAAASATWKFHWFIIN